MHLNIKNHEAHRIAQEIAAIKGESLTQVVTTALMERLERVRRSERRAEIIAKVMEIADRYASLPDADTRTAEEILGYDENGLPK